jgi:rRNA processing protein Krr1/Pno1
VGNQIWCVQFLLEHKAEPHVKNNAGILPEQLCNLDKVKKLFESGDVVTVQLDIPREVHKRVIGQKGAKIQEIRIESGAQVTVPGPNDKNSAIVIKGRPEAVAKAKAMINRIADMGLKIAEEGAFSGAAVNADPAAVRAAAAAENSISVSVPVAKERHALLFQKKNQTALQRFIEEHGVQITVPAASSTEHVIVIRGTPEAVDVAVKRIFAMTNPSPASAPASRSSGGNKGAHSPVVSSMSQAREQLLRTNRDDSAGGDGRRGRGTGAGANGASRDDAPMVPSKSTVVVRNVSYDATEASIKEAFTTAAGAVASVRLPTHADSGKPRGIAFVEFSSEESLQKALALNNTEIAGRTITVEVANERAPRTPTQPRSSAINGTATASPTPAPAASSSPSASYSSDAAAAAAPKPTKPKQSAGGAGKPKKTA